MKNIVIIDDDEDFIYIFKRIIKDHPAFNEVIDFQNGEEALHYFENHLHTDGWTPPPIDLVLVDINMPVMNGFEFLEKIQCYLNQISLDQAKKPKFLMITSSQLSDEKQKALGFDIVKGFLNKPIEAESLATDLLNVS